MTDPTQGAARAARQLLLLLALATLGALLFAGRAAADDVTLTLGNGYLLTEALQGDDGKGERVIDAGDPATLDADYDPVSGAFSVQPGDIEWPDGTVDVTAGITATVSVQALEPVTGSYDATTGALVGNETDYRIDLSASGLINLDCFISPVPLALSTEDVNPFYIGNLFDPGPVPPANGAVVGSWDSLPSAQGDPGCSNLDSYTAGPGALWLSNGTPAVPALRADCSDAGAGAGDDFYAKSEQLSAKAKKKKAKAKKFAKRAKKAKKQGDAAKAKKLRKKAKKLKAKRDALKARSEAAAAAGNQAITDAIDACEAANQAAHDS